MNALTPQNVYRAQWTYVTPPGYRDEIFEQPFFWQLVANGQLYRDLPIQLDDDADFIIRKIEFDGTPGGGGSSLVRFRDAFGNPLTTGYDNNGFLLPNGLILAMGFLGALSLPLESEIWCPAGSVLLVDLQPSTNGTISGLTIPLGAPPAFVALLSTFVGTAGNGRSIHVVAPVLPLQPLTVTVIGLAVTVSLATDGAAVVTSTVNDVIAAINGTPAAAALMSASLDFGSGATIATAFGPSAFPLADNGFSTVFGGTLIGVKRFRECA